MGLKAVGHGTGLPKRGLPVPHRWETIFKGRGESGGDGRGNPLPKGQGGVHGGVVGVGRERPLPLPLHDERPPSPGINVLKA